MKTTTALLMEDAHNIPDWELIERYYGQTLPQADRMRLEERMAADPAFRAEAEAWQQADRALRELALSRLVRQTVRQESHRLKWRKRIRLGIGALTTVCVVLCSVLFSTVDIATYQQDLTLLRQMRLDSAQVPPARTPRQQAFYRDFFEGQAFLADGQPALAIPLFERVLAMPNLRPYFRQSVEWQLVNAYLLAGQPENADATYERLVALGEPIYPIRDLDRWRVRWQIGWRKLVG
jgi:tetratricopeptide (TPR) repeat protein